MSGITNCVSVLLCPLHPLSFVFSGSVHVVARVTASVLFMAGDDHGWTTWCEWTTLCLSIIHWWTVSCLHFLAVLSHAAVNTGVLISLQVPAFDSFGSVPRSGIAGSCGNSMFNCFEETSDCFPQCLHPFTFPWAVHKASKKISPHPHQCLLFLAFLFLHSHSKEHEVWVSQLFAVEYFRHMGEEKVDWPLHPPI